MKRGLSFFALLLLLISTTCQAQVSYWFQGWQRKPDAQQAAAYFMVPGANVTFTYDTNRVVINAAGGGGGTLQLFGDVTSPLTALPNVTATLATVGLGGTSTKVTWNTKGLVTLGTSAILDSADFVNQGTTTTLLHGNAAGNPSWSAVNLATDVTGTLPGVWLTAGNTGAGNFLGSTDAQPLLFKRNNAQVMKFENNGAIEIGDATTSASGVSSIALGALSTVTQDYGFALGVDCHAFGNSGFAMGTGSYAVGELSVAIGAVAEADGFESFALGTSALANNQGSFIWSDSTGSGNNDTGDDQFVATATGGFYFYSSSGFRIEDTGVGKVTLTNGGGWFTKDIKSDGKVTATNFVTSAVKWVDMNINYSFSAVGATAPALTSVTNPASGSVIKQLAFDNGDELFGQCQLPHTLAITNAAFPKFYTEPHVHFDTIGTLNSTHSNVTWRIEWEWANINGGWIRGTNQATMGITNNFTHYVLDLGHITNDPPMNISAVFRCRLTRPASATQEYDSAPNSHTVILDAFDLHVPVGNQNAIGSSTDVAP